MASKFKASVAQVSPVFLDQKGTIEKTCNLMMEAHKNGAKLIAFPEAYIPTYPYWIWLDIPSANYDFFKKLFEEAVIIPSHATEELCRGAREADIYAVIGMSEKLSTQMGTMWNTNLIIDNEGKILGKHRKIVPTFAEKMVWSFGDGSGLRVWETDIGRLSTLACGNNTHCLYKYALIAQGAEIHVSNYPAYYQPQQCNIALWCQIRTAAFSLEGKLFNLCSTSTINQEMIDVLCGKDEKKREWMGECRAYSGITNPIGETLTELVDKEGLIYADLDTSEIIVAKQYHDIIGNYTRMDVVSLNLCQDEDQPVQYTTRDTAPLGSEELRIMDHLKEIRNNYKNIIEELERTNEMFVQNATKKIRGRKHDRFEK